MSIRTVYGSITIGAAIVTIIGVLIALGVFDTAEAPVVEQGEDGTTSLVMSEPTDFVRIGNLSFDAPGNRQDTPYLVYEEPGKPALQAELVMDPLSFCVTETGSFQCIAISAPYSFAFGGKRALIDGTMQSDGTVMVRKMSIIKEGESMLAYEPGRVYISWPQAVQLISSCSVQSVMQAHSLDISLRLKDGRRVYTVEPLIDAVFDVTRDAAAACGDIQLATE